MNLDQLLKGVPAILAIGALLSGAWYAATFVDQFRATQAWQRDYEHKLDALEAEIDSLRAQR